MRSRKKSRGKRGITLYGVELGGKMQNVQYVSNNAMNDGALLA
jgi:hypothetical protein